MKNRRLERVLHAIITLVAGFIVAAVGFWAINSALESGVTTQSRMDNRANFVAKCKSVEGIIGGDKCYVNGEVVFSE